MPDADKSNPRPQPLEVERSKATSCEPQVVTTNVIIPPDGGWGWVIVFGSFFCNVFVDGIVYCFGVLLMEISRSLGESKAKVSLVGSLLSGFYLITGPFVSALANRYGFRFVAVLGSVIACGAFTISSFATTVESLSIWYGVIGGIGFGMIYVPAVITTGFYFEKWRALATGIAVCGSGIGTFLLAPFTTYLVSEFGWRGAILIQGGLVLNCAIFASLFRPLRPTKVTVVNDDTEIDPDRNSLYRTYTSESSNVLPLLMRIKLARQQLGNDTTSLHSFDHDAELSVEDPNVKNHILGVNNNIFYPTLKEALNNGSGNLNKSSHSLHVMHHRVKKTSFDSPTHKQEKRLSVPIYPEILRGSPFKTHLNNDEDDVLSNCLPDESLLGKPVHDEVFIIPKQAQNGKMNGSTHKEISGLHCRSRTMSNSSSYHSSRSRSRKMTEAANRPLYRDDIFFGASLNRLPQYMSHVSGLDYTMSVTRLPTHNDLKEEEEKKCQLCPEAVRRILATMLDVSLLKSPTFLLLCVSGFITMMGFFVPFMFLAVRAESVGKMDPKLCVWLVSMIGITNTFGRVACGVVSSIPGVNALVINNIALTVGGIATILSGLSLTPVYQFIYAAVFGLAISCFASLRSILIVDLIGLEKLTNAFGILLLFQGMAAAIGAPIAGIFMDITGSYDASFYYSGGLILLSGIMCYPLNWLNRWEKRRNEVGPQKCPKVV